MATFEDALKQTGLPDAALAPIKSKWDEAFSLIVQNNNRVASINAAKAQDPNNTEYLDSLWASKAPADPKMREVEEKYQALIEESEKYLKQLRDFARENVPPVLSEDEAKNARKLVNESSDAIQTSVAQLKAQSAIIDSMLEVLQKPIEGGVISLLPPVESLKNVRGRKASTGDGKAYMTRVGEVLVDNVSTNIAGKGKFTYAAEALSEKFNATTFAENKVTGAEIEEAYFDAIGKPFRSLKSTELPESKTFEFEKNVKVSDDKSETRKVKVTVKRVNTEATPEKVEPTKQESKPEVKPEVKTETPAPKKETVAPKK